MKLTLLPHLKKRWIFSQFVETQDNVPSQHKSLAQSNNHVSVRDRLSSHSSMRLRHTKLRTEFPLVAFTHYACAWREMWNCAAMAQQAGTQAATLNSQPSWSKGLKRSGLYYEGIVGDCHQVLELHRRSTICPPLVQSSIKKLWRK